jgi:hypothetical protein
MIANKGKALSNKDDKKKENNLSVISFLVKE